MWCSESIFFLPSIIAAVVMSPQTQPSSRAKLFGLYLPVTLVVSSVLGPSTASAETWTSLNGNQSIEAKMLGMWNDSVVLEIDGTRRVTVPLDLLRSESRIQARELWEKIQQNRTSRVDELMGLAAAAAAPAPSPLPTLPPAPAYSKPVAGAKVAQFIEHRDQQIANGHLIAIYDSLPPSYRKDVDEIAKLVAAKIDPAGWEAIVNSLHKIGDLIVTRQNWVFSHPRFQQMDPDDLDTLKQVVLLTAGTLREGLDPQAMQLSNLQSMEFGQWLAQRNAAIAPYVAASSQHEANVPRHFSVVSESADAAEVKMSQGSHESTMKLKNVEGFWVTESLATSWAENAASAKLELQKETEGALMAELAMFSMVQPLLQSLEFAQDEGNFHAAVETMIAGIAPNLEQFAATAGMNLGLASNNRRGPGGFDSEYGDYDEMMMEEMMEEEMEDMEEDYNYEEEMSERDRRARQGSR